MTIPNIDLTPRALYLLRAWESVGVVLGACPGPDVGGDADLIRLSSGVLLMALKKIEKHMIGVTQYGSRGQNDVDP